MEKKIQKTPKVKAEKPQKVKEPTQFILNVPFETIINLIEGTPLSTKLKDPEGNEYVIRLKPTDKGMPIDLKYFETMADKMMKVILAVRVAIGKAEK